MLSDYAWKQVMREGTADAHLMYDISMIEKKKLNMSIDAPIDMKFADWDTTERLLKGKIEREKNDLG